LPVRFPQLKCVSSFGATTLSVSLEAAFAKELFMEGFPRVDIPRIPSETVEKPFSIVNGWFWGSHDPS